MFCTNPCYNELFSGYCCAFDCKSQFNEGDSSTGNAQTSGDGQDARCLSCEKMIGVRNETGQFPSGKFPGYIAAKQKRQSKQSQFENDLQNETSSTAILSSTPYITSQSIGDQCVRCMKPVYAAEFCYSMNLPWHLRVKSTFLSFFLFC